MAYAIKMARATAPAIDRAARRIHDAGYPHVMNAVRFSYHNTQMIVTFASTADMEIGGPVLAEELRADGFGWHTQYDNGNAVTGNRIGLLVTHPLFLTRLGDEARDRPASWRVEAPMPGQNVHLTAEVIEKQAQEAAEVVRDLLRQQALKEYGDLPKGTFDLPPMAENPLETEFHREVAEHNEEPVDAPKPRPLNEAFAAPEEDDGEW